MVNSEEFQYPLPEEAIATEPVHPRRAAKMLVRTSEGEVSHHTFEALPDLLQREGVDGLWANDTRVLHARILATKTTGGGLEVFLLSPESAPMESVLASSEPCRWKAMVRNAKRWTDGHASVTGTATHMTIERETRGEDGTWTVRLEWDSDATFAEVLEDLGKTPLPPYMRRAAVEGDKEDYQTVFAMAPGSVAAPTAGLHFDDTLLAELEAVGLPLGRLTLHVGAGTFKPLTEGAVEDHVMHAERCVVGRSSLEAMAHQSRRVATGTTSLRTLESLFWLAAHHRLHGEWLDRVPQRAPYGELGVACAEWRWTDRDALDHLLAQGPWRGGQLSFETQLMIVPGYKVRMVHGLITNFHQPGSTLLCLVAAFVGGSDWKDMYADALAKGYRFLSYGDGSLLLRS